jgi:hypothetical protein
MGLTWDCDPDVEVIKPPGRGRPSGLRANYSPPDNIPAIAHAAMSKGMKEPIMILSQSVAWLLNDGKWNVWALIEGSEALN